MAAMMTGVANPDDKPFEFVIDLKSVQSFHDIINDAANGTDFIFSVLKSFYTDIEIKLKGSLIGTVIGGLGAFMPGMASSPLMLLKDFKSFQLDLKFRDPNELPKAFKDNMTKGNDLFKSGFTSIQKDLGEEKDYVKETLEMIDSGLELNVFAMNIVTFSVSTKGPGFCEHAFSQVQNKDD